MPEHVAFLAVGGQQLVGDRLADGLLVLRSRQPRRGHDQLVVHPAAAHRGGAQRLLGGARQLLHPGHEDRGQAGRELLVTVRRGEQLLGVVGVALGPVHDPDQLGRIEHAPPAAQLRERGDVRRERRRVQRPEVDRGDVRQPEQLRDHRAQRVPTVQVIGPVAAEHRHPLAVQHPGQERDQVARGPVGPVQVLEDEQHRVRLRQLGEQAEHRPEQLLAGQLPSVAGGRGAWPVIGQQAAEHRPVRDQLGHPGRGVAGDAAQRVGERQVRHAVAELGAAPGQHAEAALPGPPRQLGHQPRLADSRVPADQGDRRFPRGHRIEQPQQPGKLHGTANHGSACVLLHSHDYLIRLGHSPNSAPARTGAAHRLYPGRAWGGVARPGSSPRPRIHITTR